MFVTQHLTRLQEETKQKASEVTAAPADTGKELTDSEKLIESEKGGA